MSKNLILAISGSILVFLLQLLCSTSLADVIYVDGDVSPGGDGLTWPTAYKYLQDALNDPCLAYGDEIWVAEGITRLMRTNSFPVGAATAKRHSSL